MTRSPSCKLVLLSILFWLATKPALAHSEHDGTFFQSLTAQNLTPTVSLTGLGIAFIAGAGHALAPGHGKSMMAAYLVGAKGTPQQALLLSLITTIAHTASVFGLGVLALWASRYIMPEQLYPLLSFLSGLTVCGLGFWLLYQQLRHSSDCHHAHHHLAEAVSLNVPEEVPGAAFSQLKSLVTLGIAGGIVPCPSALVLLLSAISLHREAYGIALLGSFSFGLAAVLAAIGLTAVYAYHWLERIPSGGMLSRYVPVLSAVVVIVAGTVLAAGAIISGSELAQTALPFVELPLSHRG
ncbi:MAG: nickel/cobalt transporter [Cyanophyceae cyanobacterium]